MTAFYPEDKLIAMRGFLTGRNLRMRELFGTITLIFMLYIVVMAVLLYLFGERTLSMTSPGYEYRGHGRVSAQLYHT